MVLVLDVIIPSFLRERYLFACSPMTIIMWPFWIFNVAVLVCGRFGRHSLAGCSNNVSITVDATYRQYRKPSLEVTPTISAAFSSCDRELLPACVYILWRKHYSRQKIIYILALEMASPGNQHCASCIGALSCTILKIMPRPACRTEPRNFWHAPSSPDWA